MNARLLAHSTALAATAAVTASGPVLGEVGNEAPAFLATDPIRGKAMIADPASGTLQVADLGNLQVSPAAYAGKNVRGVVVNAVSGLAYVIDDTGSGWLVAVDMKDGRLIRRTTVGHLPASISADFTRGEIYVSNRGDASVSIVHAGTMKVIAKVPVGRYAHTANALEARLVADGMYGDTWRRTMHFFRAWTTPGPGSESRVPVLQPNELGHGSGVRRNRGRVRSVEA